jgi:hypothetical protein
MNNPEVSLYFPEPVLRYKFEDYKNFNLNLKRYIYELQKKTLQDRLNLIEAAGILQILNNRT